MENRLIVGICGGTGSGKTTLAGRLSDAFGDDALLISMDSYYRHTPELTYEERCRVNYDHPDAFDFGLLASHLRTLKEGGDVECPVYDFTTYLRTEQTVRLGSRPLIVVEGILLFCCPAAAEQLDLKVFVDTGADVRIIRRILRDVRERGRTLESVTDQYLKTVRPMHERYIEPYKKTADLIVPEGGLNEASFDAVLSAVRKKLNS